MATINIKHIRSSDIQFTDVDLNITVLKFKEMIEEKSGSPKAEQRLILKGAMLVDTKTLAESGVTDGAVLFLATPKVAAAPPPSTTTPTPAPNRNLFEGPPSTPGGGGGQGRGFPQINDAMLAQLDPQQRAVVQEMLSTPQGQAMLRQLQENPELAERMMMQSMGAGRGQGIPMGMGPPRAGPFPRDVFNIAMDVLNGAPIPEGYPQIQSRGSRPTSSNQNASTPSPQSGPRREYVTRAQIDAALASCGMTKPERTDAGPATSSSKVVDVTKDSDLTPLLKDAGNKLVVIDFFATWCGPCQMLAPHFERLAKQYEDVVFLRVDAEKCVGLKTSMRIDRYPTMVFLRSMNEIHRFSGANPTTLEDTIKAHRVAPTAVADNNTSSNNNETDNAKQDESSGNNGNSDKADTAEKDASTNNDTSAAASKYSEQLAQLQAMGFTDDAKSLQALETAGGDVMTAVTFLAE